MGNTEDKVLTDMLLELQEYMKDGIPFYLNGKRCSPVKAAQECLLREKGSYMRDYICDEDHHVVAVRFDRIRECSAGENCFYNL